MAKTDILNIRIEPELKKQVEATLNDLGMNIAEAVTIFLKQVVMTDSIPFIIKKPRLNVETIKAMEETKKGINLSKEYTDLNEMWKDLEKEEWCMLTIRYTNLFKKDYKLAKKRGLNIYLLHQVVELLANNKPLPEKYRDHPLTGNYKRIQKMSYTTWLAINIFNR